MSSNINTAIPPYGSATTAGVRANFVAAKTEIEALQNAIGYCDANHAGGTQAITANTWTQLLNDAAGPYCQAHLPNGYGPLWNSATGQLDFSEMPISTMLETRIDIGVTTTSLNQAVTLRVRFGIGSASEFSVPWGSETSFKSTGLKAIGAYNGYYIGSADIRDYPARIEIRSDASATVQVNGWYNRLIIPVFEL